MTTGTTMNPTATTLYSLKAACVGNVYPRMSLGLGTTVHAENSPLSRSQAIVRGNHIPTSSIPRSLAFGPVRVRRPRIVTTDQIRSILWSQKNLLARDVLPRSTSVRTSWPSIACNSLSSETPQLAPPSPPRSSRARSTNGTKGRSHLQHSRPCDRLLA